MTADLHWRLVGVTNTGGRVVIAEVDEPIYLRFAAKDFCEHPFGSVVCRLVDVHVEYLWPDGWSRQLRREYRPSEISVLLSQLLKWRADYEQGERWSKMRAELKANELVRNAARVGRKPGRKPQRSLTASRT